MRAGKSIRYEAEVAWRIQMGLSFTGQYWELVA